MPAPIVTSASPSVTPVAPKIAETAASPTSPDPASEEVQQSTSISSGETSDERFPLPIPKSSSISSSSRQDGAVRHQQHRRVSPAIRRTSLDPGVDTPSDESIVGCLGSCYEIRSWAIFVGVIDVAAVLPLTCITLVLGLEPRHWDQTSPSLLLGPPQHLPHTRTAAVDTSVLPKLIGVSAGYWSIFRLIAVTCCAYLAVQGTRRNVAWMLQSWLINAAGNFCVTTVFMVAFAMAANDAQLTSTDYALISTLSVAFLLGVAQFPFIFSRFRRAKRLAKTATALTRSSLPYGHLA